MNCTKKGETILKKNKSYIISYEDKEREKYYDSIKTHTNRVLLPPSTKGFFYGESQLIIDKKGNLYFYQKEYIQILCSYGSEKDTLPHFLNLQPKDIVKIPKKCLNDFLSENILSKEKKRTFWNVQTNCNCSASSLVELRSIEKDWTGLRENECDTDSISLIVNVGSIA